MKVTVFRVDDRLIHGQIVTAWLAQADAKQIVCADDKAAKDELQKMLLQLATPKGVKLHLLTLAEAKDLIQSDMSDTKTLLLVRGTNEAAELLPLLPDLKSVNIGNLNMKTGKKKILSNVWVDDNDLEGFKKMQPFGKEVEVRAVPNEKSQNIYELLAKDSLI